MKYLFFFFFLLFLSPSASLSQNSQTKTNYGSKQIFSYSVQSTYGVQSASTSSPGVKVETEAVLKLKDGSFVTNKFGDDNGNASAVFTVSPNGSTVDLRGVTGQNQLLIDDGTLFRVAITKDESQEPVVTQGVDDSIKAEGTANAFHTSTITVNKGDEAFFNTFTQNYLDGL